jgi:hypothetical protein
MLGAMARAPVAGAAGAVAAGADDEEEEDEDEEDDFRCELAHTTAWRRRKPTGGRVGA